MNKITSLILSLVLFFGMKAVKVDAQVSAVAQASAVLLDNESAQVKEITSFSQIATIGNSGFGKSILLSDHGNDVSSTIQNLASFSIKSENSNSFSVSLPTQPLILKNNKNENTVQVSSWKSSSKPGKGDTEKNIWTYSLDASIKMGTSNDHPAGVYTGTYLVNFVYN